MFCGYQGKWPLQHQWAGHTGLTAGPEPGARGPEDRCLDTQGARLRAACPAWWGCGITRLISQDLSLALMCTHPAVPAGKNAFGHRCTGFWTPVKT